MRSIISASEIQSRWTPQIISVHRRLLQIIRLRIKQLRIREEKTYRKLLGQKQTEIEIRLQKISTRELLDMLKRHRGVGHPCLSYDDSYKAIRQPDWEDGGDIGMIEGYAIRNVLATRPHIKNKVEGKTHRRKMATMHHGKKKKSKSS